MRTLEDYAPRRGLSVPAYDVVGDGTAAVCYFAHSFAVDCDDRLVAARTTIDGREVPAVVRSGRLSGVQFHPEKSAADGRRMLEAWLAA